MNWAELGNSAGTQVPLLEMTARLLMAALFGAVIGYDREAKDKHLRVCAPTC